MEFQTIKTQNVRDIAKILNELFPEKLFNDIKHRSTAFWTPRLLAMAAILWMVCGEATIVIAFQSAFDILCTALDNITKTNASYQGFTGQLAKYQSQLMKVIIPHLRNLTKIKLAKFWKIGSWLIIAADGTRETVARNKELQSQFAPRKKKRRRRSRSWIKKHTSRKVKKQSKKDREKKASTPFLGLTLFYHVVTGLPWDWRFGPSDASERDHAIEMAKSLPNDALLVADAGFIGYDFWSSLMNSHVRFLVRVGANVHLLTKLGYAREDKDTVYLWPNNKQDLPPLKLRLLKIHDGKKMIYLVTNTQSSELTDNEAHEIYRRRWCIEVFFRTFKQTFDKRKLKCMASTNVALELEWSLIALWVMCLYGKEEIGKRYEISRLSPANAIRAFAKTCREYRCEPKDNSCRLRNRLAEAVIDDYHRKNAKTNRDYPRKSQRSPTGIPNVKNATKTQQIHASNVNTAMKIT
jgi:IS4 transposase